ncbi:MAG: aldehyde reductase [Bacteroidota bacterium]
MANPSKVLLTGVTGFLGSHTTIQLLNKGYEVLGTLRNMKRAEEIKAVIAQHTDQIEQLHFAEADLTDASAWEKLMQGVDYVQHIASPFPRVLPKNEEKLIGPAKNGTLNVLKAAAKRGVKRVVLTSSTGAIVYGRPKSQRSGTYTERDWTDEHNKSDSTPYFRSKTIAEKAAWEFIEKDTSGMELAVICPGAILGPVLEKDFGTSANIVIKTMDGSSPALPKLGFPMVDVRSVADLQIRAMESPKAAGERFAATAGYHSFKEVAAILKAAYPSRKIPSATLPNFAVRLFAKLDPTLGPILIDLGVERKVSNAKAKEVLDWQPIDNKEAILACAKSVFEQGILK